MNTSARPPEGRVPSHGEDAAQRQEGRHPVTSARPPEGRAPSPALAEGTCHVWSVELEQPAHVQAALAEHLSEDEQRHMQALRSPRLRSHYAVAHGALRVLLGRYLGIAPRLCRYATGPHGKPMLAKTDPGLAAGGAPASGSSSTLDPDADANPGSDAGANPGPDAGASAGPRADTAADASPPDTAAALHFNMSHAGTRALIAITRGVEIGVDIELRRDMDDMAGVARTVLSQADLDLWLALPEAQRPAAFYAIWTRKEAVSKAAGTGLYMDFPGLSVEFRPGRPPAVRRIDAAFGKPQEWLLAELDCAAGYSAALAARTPALRISLHAARIGAGLATDTDAVIGTP